jgi:hypothetical protein
MQAVEHAGHDRERDPRRHELATLRRGLQQARHRLAVHVVHYQEQLAIERNHVENRHHVGVNHPRRKARLVQEHRRELGILGELRVQTLDRHRARESDGPHQAPQVHRGHAAGGDLLEELIAADHALGSGLRHPPSMPERGLR